jgi:glycosyltransferase 2 family protein
VLQGCGARRGEQAQLLNPPAPQAPPPRPSRPSRPSGKRRRRGRWLGLRAAGSLAALLLLGLVFRHAHVARIRSLLVAAPWLLATPVFYLGVLACDALGWRRLVMSPGRPPSWRRLLEVRTAAEALGLSLPSGGVLAEGVAVYLLRSACGIPAGLAVASLAARRFYIFFSFGLALTASAAVGHSLLTSISARVIGRGGLGWLVALGAAFMLLVAFGLRAALLGGELAGRMVRALARLPIRGVRRWLEPRVAAFSEVDRQVETALAGRRGGPAVTTLCYLGIWLAESCETFFILGLLGAGLSFRTVFSFEAPLTLLRGLSFFTPSGLGIQDLGYLAFLKGLGVRHAIDVGGAFVLVKRGKEVFWIIIGYLLLARHAWRPSAGAGDAPGSAGNA